VPVASVFELVRVVGYRWQAVAHVSYRETEQADFVKGASRW